MMIMVENLTIHQQDHKYNPFFYCATFVAQFLHLTFTFDHLDLHIDH